MCVPFFYWHSLKGFNSHDFLRCSEAEIPKLLFRETESENNPFLTEKIMDTILFDITCTVPLTSSKK